MKRLFVPYHPAGAAFASFVCLSLASKAAPGPEDLRSLENARVSNKFDRRLGEDLRTERFQASQEGLALSVIASVAYDDNIFQSAQNAQEDMVTRVSPEIRYTVGQPQGRAWISLAYEGTAVIYLDQDDDSRVDHVVTVEAVARRRSFRLAYSGSWARLGEPDSDVGGAPDRSEWENRVVLGWEPRGKTSAEIFGEWSTVDQDSPLLNDLEEVSAGLSLLYTVSPKTVLGVSYQFGEVDVDGSPSQEFHRMTGRLNWKPSSKVELSVEGGGEYRDFDSSGSDWEPVVTARASWTPRRGTELYLTGYRREEASAFFDEQNFIVTGISAGWRQRIHGGWTGNVEAGWEEADYFSTVGGVANREDTLFFVRPSVEYRFEDQYVFRLFYQWTDNDSNDADFGFSNNELGLSMEYEL